ncbi:hypothetical protein GCM10008018_27460 [Paenibacillus marchantiophytorum]|uniref:DUF4871 domain-containing protein n=1 Tax=Paenibacillus marchantiophytorum TaxID=1619310 RepID=A0ABQ1ENS7_9BACL|nr:hypothetical protein [Paenibacillus marchantiophytorum]GFZ80347.1 hypothetical protein GCM10008018_27460 [Paenibacillus marchantiophytorum]
MIKESPNVLDDSWQVSSMFKNGDFILLGEQGKIGFIYNDTQVVRFYPGKKQKYMWHFWAEKPQETQKLFGQKVKIIGVSKNNGEKVNVFEGSIGIPNTAIKDNDKVGRMPSLMTLPSKGLWRLEAHVDEKLFGSVVVEVH